MIDARRVREILHYDPDTGVFTRIASPYAKCVGRVVGTVQRATGYKIVWVENKRYLGHVLAWAYMTGEWPAHEIDHRDLNKSNDAWDNLRAATHQNNMCNYPVPRTNTTGYKGVSLNRGRYMACIRVNGKSKNLGRFSDPATAHAAYVAASETYHGEFGRA